MSAPADLSTPSSHDGRSQPGEPPPAWALLPAIFFDWDVATGQVHRSGALEQVTGVRSGEDEPTVAWWRARIHPDDLLRLDREAEAHAAAGESRYTAQYRVRHADGRWVPVWENGTFISDNGVARRLFGCTLDVSGIRSAEEELVRTKSMLEKVVAVTPDLLYVYDLVEKRNVFANREVLQILGYTPEQFQAMGARLLDLLHPEDHDALPARYAALARLADGEVWESQLRMRHADGAFRLIRTRETVFARDADGNVTQIFGVGQDVTVERETTERLARERHQFAQVLDQLPSGVAVAQAPHGDFALVNAKAREIWRMPAAHARSVDDYQEWAAWSGDGRLLAPSEYPLARALRGENVNREIVRFRRGDGALAVSEASACPIRDEQGQITAAVAVFDDVTDSVAQDEERRRLEAALARSEARARRIIESALLGVLYWRMDGGVTYANDAFLRMIGYTRAELDSGKVDWRALTPPEWHHTDEEAIAQLRTRGTSDLFVKQYLRKDGTRVDVVLGAANFDDQGTEGVTLVVDISAQKRLEEQLRAQLAFEKELLGIVSHDLRGPLAVITMSTALARARVNDDRLGAILTRISSNADRLGRIVADLLDATQARLGGGIPLSPRPADLQQIAREAMEDQQAAHPDRSFVLTGAEACPGRWDPDRLSQVFQNLLGNAVRHGSSAAPIEVTVWCEGDRVKARVRNGGPPIPAELLPHVFEPFRTSERRRTRDASRGLGLGLYIVHSIVAAHGGTVAVTSSEAEGTAFTLELPRETAG